MYLLGYEGYEWLRLKFIAGFKAKIITKHSSKMHPKTRTFHPLNKKTKTKGITAINWTTMNSTWFREI